MAAELPPGFMLIPKKNEPPNQSSRTSDIIRTAAGFPFVPANETILGKMLGGQFSRMAGLTARGMLQGPSSLVGLPLDAAVAAYNLSTGQRLRQPSEAISQSLTQVGFPEPQGIAETGVAAMAGGIPEARTQLTSLLSPRLQKVAETPFMGQQNMRDILINEAVDAGYVIPPATVGKSTVREIVSGKVATQQAASEKNQSVTNSLAARALGLPEDQPLSPESIQEVRRNAGRVYEKIKNDRIFSSDDQYLNDLAALEEDALQISRDFPNLDLAGTKEVGNLVKGLTEGRFTSKGLVDTVKRLRFQAKENLKFGVASPAQRELGNAQMDAAEILEDLMERELSRQGAAELVQEFKNARRLIAKSHSVENALNPSTGNVVASTLTKELNRRKPLTGELSLIARFGGAFPSAAQDIKASRVSNLDAAIATMLGTTLGTAPFLAGVTTPYAALSALGGLAYPGARYAYRESVLSPSMQQSLVRRPQQGAGGLLAPTAAAMTTVGAQSQSQPQPQSPYPLPLGFTILPGERALGPTLDAAEELRRRASSNLSRTVPRPAR